MEWQRLGGACSAVMIVRTARGVTVARVPLPNPAPAEQSMAMPAIRRRWTTAQVRALTDESRAWPRYELIAGELFVTPAPGGVHQLVILELAVQLHQYLERWPVGVVVTSPADLELRPDTITQPDVFVVPMGTAIAGEYLEWPDVKSLLLAIEVLSPSSVRTDRITKRDFYLDSGVAEYWIVDVDARAIERWTPSEETPRIERGELSWAPAGEPALAIDVPTLFDRVNTKRRLLGG